MGSAAFETITWVNAVAPDLPDADMTVLVEIDGESEPVWLGFFDGTAWRSVSDGDIFAGTVTGWADMPTGRRPKP